MDNVDKAYFILTYKRPIALQECLRSLFNNTEIRPDLVYILDDNSGFNLQMAIDKTARDLTSQGVPTNFLINNVNMGVGHQFQTLYRLIEQINPRLAYIIEGDYYFRNEWNEDVIEMFELFPYTIACPMMDHNDMRLPEKFNHTFKDLMIEYFEKDIAGREYMYNFENPHVIQTSRGPMQYFGVSNSCGAQILHWKRIQEFFFQDLQMQSEYWEILKKGFHEGEDRSRASDAAMSCVHSGLWDEWAFRNSIDISKNFAYVNILPSLCYHACSQGLNGQLDPSVFPDGSAFPGVNSGTFPQDYNNWRRS